MVQLAYSSSSITCELLRINCRNNVAEDRTNFEGSSTKVNRASAPKCTESTKDADVVDYPRWTYLSFTARPVARVFEASSNRWARCTKALYVLENAHLVLRAAFGVTDVAAVVFRFIFVEYAILGANKLVNREEV